MGATSIRPPLAACSRDRAVSETRAVRGPITLTTLTGGNLSDSDGFSVLPNGNWLISDADAVNSYNQYNPTTGMEIAGTNLVAVGPGGAACGSATGVDNNAAILPGDLVFDCNFDSLVVDAVDFSTNTLTFVSQTFTGTAGGEDISLARPGRAYCSSHARTRVNRDLWRRTRRSWPDNQALAPRLSFGFRDSQSGRPRAAPLFPSTAAAAQRFPPSSTRRFHCPPGFCARTSARGHCSVAQIGQPIYQSAIGRWKTVGLWPDPLNEVLGHLTVPAH